MLIYPPKSHAQIPKYDHLYSQRTVVQHYSYAEFVPCEEMKSEIWTPFYRKTDMPGAWYHVLYHSPPTAVVLVATWFSFLR